MNFVFRKLKSSEYLRNFTILSSGTIIAQAIPMIFYPIISRLFSPTDFGLLSSLTAVTGILVAFITLGYPSSILITKNKSESINVISLTLFLSLLISSLAFITLFLFIDYIPFYSENLLLKKYYWFSFLTALSIVIYNVYNEWSVRYKKFKQLSFNKIINSSSVSSSETLFGIIKLFNGIDLIVGDFVGRFISAISCIFSFLRRDKNIIKEVSTSKMKLIAKKYIDCPKFIMPGQLLNTFGASLPIFFIGTYFSQHEIGLYAMANMIIAVPASIISRAMRDVFRQRANEDYTTTGSCRPILLKTTKYLSILSIIGFSSLFIIAPWLFSFALGEQWLEAGVYARYLIPMVAISFVTNVFTSVYIIAQKMNWTLYWQLIYIIILLISLYISVKFNNIYIMLLAVTISKSIAYLLNFYLPYKFSIGSK